MGNEASLEGGEGTPSGLPEGLAPDGKGGFVRVPEGTPVNLSELTEEQRRQLAAAMARAQGRQPGGAAAARRQGNDSSIHLLFLFFFKFRRRLVDQWRKSGPRSVHTHFINPLAA